MRTAPFIFVGGGNNPSATTSVVNNPGIASEASAFPSEVEEAENTEPSLGFYADSVCGAGVPFGLAFNAYVAQHCTNNARDPAYAETGKVCGGQDCEPVRS